MNLRVYLATKNLKAYEFCKIIDCDRSYISAIMNGRRIPGKKMARNIEKATEGQVKFFDNNDAETGHKEKTS
jgi:transcriptional regulator with XRE-family HTH domain